MRIVGLGDSTTAGTPGFLSPLEAPPDGEGDVTSQYGYWLLREHPRWEFFNRGINGQRSDEIAARFERDVTALAPDVVIILAGVNDVYQKREVAGVQASLTGMYVRAAELGIAVVAGSVLPWDTAAVAQNEALHALNEWIAAYPGVHFCDLHRAVQSVGDADHLRESPEGLHPTPKGYHRMAVALKPILVGLAPPGEKGRR